MIPVTVIDVTGNEFVQRKTADGADGYDAVQVAYDDQKEQRMKQPAIGHLKKHGSSAKRIVREFRLEDGEELPESHPGAALFQDGQWVDVIGTTKGKGFQGVVKRYNFGGGPAAHGSGFHRRAGSTGMRSTPGRCLPGVKKAGRMGGERVTQENLRVLQIDSDKGLLIVEGAVPGAKDSLVTVRVARKKR